MKFSLKTRGFHANPVNLTVLLKLSKRNISFIMRCVKYTKSFHHKHYKHNTVFRKILVISTKDHVKTLSFS